MRAGPFDIGVDGMESEILDYQGVKFKPALNIKRWIGAAFLYNSEVLLSREVVCRFDESADFTPDFSVVSGTACRLCGHDQGGR